MYDHILKGIYNRETFLFCLAIAMYDHLLKGIYNIGRVCVKKADIIKTIP